MHHMIIKSHWVINEIANFEIVMALCDLMILQDNAIYAILDKEKYR